MHYGVLYRSAVVLGAGPELPPAQLPEQWHGQPGTRAPHVRPDGYVAWRSPELPDDPATALKAAFSESSAGTR